MATNGVVPNGSAQSPIEISSASTIVGINFGNSYASIAVLTKEGQAECIANEDGERQIACSISFHGEELYIGNQAKQQLVKNAENTIVDFRNLLGKKFSEIPKDGRPTSAPVIQHPDQPDEPAYKVKVLQPSPSPLPPSALTTRTNTPAASHAATPRSEPVSVDRILTPSDATSIFLGSLLKSAEDFLGKKVDGAVISVPHWFDDKQLSALKNAASDAGINVLQLLEDSGAAAVAANESAPPDLPVDRTQLIVDLGASSLSLTLLQVSDGLFHSLASSVDRSIGGNSIDDRLVKFFAKEFTKKTKAALAVCPPGDKQDARAEARLRLALEHTKRTVSASPGAATCSVESLKDGLDFTGTINRLRFDMEARPIYAAVQGAIEKLLAEAGRDWLHIDEIVYVGGSSSLPGLDGALAALYPESTVTPFSAGTVVGGGLGDPTTIVARGCALQAALLASISDPSIRGAVETHTSIPALSKTIGLLFPTEGDVQLGGTWLAALPRETALPARRLFALDAENAGSSFDQIGIEIWEAEESIKIEKVKPPVMEDEDDEEDEEPEEEEVKEKVVEKRNLLGSLVVPVRDARNEGNVWKASVQIQVITNTEGGVEFTAWEVGSEGRGEKASASVGVV